MENTIEIPEGYEARIKGNKVIFEPKESENERIKKDCIKYLDWEYQHCPSNEDKMKIEKCIVWLEKQGEQKLDGTFVNVDDVREDFVNEVYRVLDSDPNNDRANQIIEAFDSLPTLKLEKQGSQNLANSAKTCNVEPKFKVGDWIVRDTDGLTISIKSVKDGIYYFHQGGKLFVNEVDECFHLWTIQDAKDGDILAEHETIVLFKEIEGLNIRCYCTYHYLGYNPALRVDTLQNKTPYRPATKEQCDLLFQKMKEAGYEWDAEKKELINIEQKPAWSKDDEEMLASFFHKLEVCTLLTNKEYQWANKKLKSLKAKFTWKPSEEQMFALESAITNCVYSEYQDCLKEIMNQLKKLTE